MTLVREAKVLARLVLSWYLNWVPDQALSTLALTSLEHGYALSPKGAQVSTLGGSCDLGLVWLVSKSTPLTLVYLQSLPHSRRVLHLDWVGAGSRSWHRSDPVQVVSWSVLST